MPCHGPGTPWPSIACQGSRAEPGRPAQIYTSSSTIFEVGNWLHSINVLTWSPNTIENELKTSKKQYPQWVSTDWAYVCDYQTVTCGLEMGPNNVAAHYIIIPFNKLIPKECVKEGMIICGSSLSSSSSSSKPLCWGRIYMNFVSPIQSILNQIFK